MLIALVEVFYHLKEIYGSTAQAWVFRYENYIHMIIVTVREQFGHRLSYIRDCREMPKKVFDFPNELIDKVIEIS